MKKIVPFLLLIILFAGAAWYSLMKPSNPISERPPAKLTPASASRQQQAPTPPAADTAAGNEVEPEPEFVETPAEPLPALYESDPEVNRALADITGAESLAKYLVMDQVISRVVASIDSLTSRQVPVHINPVKPADAKFLTDTEGERLVLSPRNFARYDGYISVLQEMDTPMLMAFYQRYSPLFQQAWEENGGQGSFHDRLLEVIDDLLETPDVAGPVYLTRYEAVYLFETPELEAMTAGQKVLVRMGSVNASVVKEKLMEVRAQLKSQGG